MKKAIYPGSFDPITIGHLDMIKRAAALVDELIVVVLINDKKTPLFSLEERVEMLETEVKSFGNVKVTGNKGLLVDFAREQNADAIIRGLRCSIDFEYELAMSQTNKALYEDLETIFLITDPGYSYISSSVVKEVAAFGGDISKFVPASVEKKIWEKLK